jgi:hypothetical protein
MTCRTSLPNLNTMVDLWTIPVFIKLQYSMMKPSRSARKSIYSLAPTLGGIMSTCTIFSWGAH